MMNYRFDVGQFRSDFGFDDTEEDAIGTCRGHKLIKSSDELTHAATMQYTKGG